MASADLLEAGATVSAPAGSVPSRRRRRRSVSRRPPAVVALAAALVALASLAPVAYLLGREGFSLARLGDELANPSTVPLVRNTALLVVCATTVASLLGVGLALLVARTDLPLRRMFAVLFTLPLGVPTFVAGYTWVALSFRFAPRSTFIYGLRGAAIVLSLGLFPYVYLPVLAALRNLDPAQEEAARSLGRGPVSTFLRVTLPQLRPAIAGGALIISLHLLAEYGALQLLRYQTLTTTIVRRATVLGAPEAARSLSVVLVVGALGLLGLDRLVRGRPRPTRTGTGTPRPATVWRLGRAKPVAVLGSLAMVVVSLGVPIYVAVTGLARRVGGAGAPIDWAGLWDALGNTAQFAGFAALVATIVALPVSYLAVRHPGPLAATVERATWVAHALPGVLIALSLVYLSVRWLGPLYQTPTLLVLAYVVLYLPLAVGSQQVGIVQASRRYDEVSRSLGRGALTTFARVTLPLASPAVMVGALLVALDAGKELTTTLLLRPTGTHTLATALWTTTNGEVLDFSAASPYGVALLLVGAIPAAFLARRTLRDLSR